MRDPHADRVNRVPRYAARCGYPPDPRFAETPVGIDEIEKPGLEAESRDRFPRSFSPSHMADAPTIQRVKPPKWLVRLTSPMMSGLASRSKLLSRYMLVIHYVGRRTGQPYRVPIGYRSEEGRLMTLSSDVWRLNFEGGRDCEVTYLRDRQPARVTLEADYGALADFYVGKFDELGAKKVATDLGMRVNLDRAPTREEWIEALDRDGMQRIWIDLRRSDEA